MCASPQKEIVMTNTKNKPDMRYPERSDASKAAEKKVGEAPFAPKGQPIDPAWQSATTKDQGH